MKAGRLAGAVLLLALAGCQQGTEADSASGASPSAASSQPTGLGGAGGEQSSSPRPSLRTPATTAPGWVAEVPGRCPYISAADFADLEGDRVGRVTVLGSPPVGCRFYFEFDPDTVVGEITLARYGSATEAYNAMVRSAAGHPEVQSERDIGAGAVAFRTPLQGSRTWQCVFAKGTSVVTVRTRQPYPALNAFLLARAIVPRIK